MEERGGWAAAVFILGMTEHLFIASLICFLPGHEVAERMAFISFVTNFITYLITVMHKSPSEANTIVTVTFGLWGITPILGGFLADAHLGRYATISVFSQIYLLGLLLLTISAVYPPLHPSDNGCEHVNVQQCIQASSTQMGCLYIALLVMAVGYGGIAPCVSVFGADQFDTDQPKDKKRLEQFFNSLYVAFTTGMLMSVTLLIFIQLKFGWPWGMASLTISMALANLFFFAGTPFYRHKLPSGSPLTRFAQVVAAAFKKRKLQTPKNENLLYELLGPMSAIPGARKIPHSHRFRFLDKAAIKTGLDSDTEGDWSLCTVTQVEELKTILSLLPICLSTMLLFTSMIQLVTYSTVQAGVMNRHLTVSFIIPPASVSVFFTLFVMGVLPLYELIYVPLLHRITGNPHGTTLLQRIGIGMVMCILLMFSAGLIEHKRLQLQEMSALWLIVQHCVVGLAEVFARIGLMKFFYCQAPDGMRSIGNSLLSLTEALGGFLGSFLVSIVKAVTGSTNGWLADNINQGHLDYYYWLLAVLNVINFVLFLHCANQYQYKTVAEGTDGDLILSTTDESKSEL